MKGVAHHIRLRVPKSAANQLIGQKRTADDSLSGSSSFDGGGGQQQQRWRTASGTRSSRLNSLPGSRDLDSISWDSSSMQLRHVAILPSFYSTKPNLISFHQADPLLANGNSFISIFEFTLYSTTLKLLCYCFSINTLF
jgi:hypothetical protein